MSAHATSSVSASRGSRDKRTTFYGYCTCGRGTTTSVNAASVEKKLRAHASGDDSGMYRAAS